MPNSTYDYAINIKSSKNYFKNAKRITNAQVDCNYILKGGLNIADMCHSIITNVIVCDGSLSTKRDYFNKYLGIRVQNHGQIFLSFYLAFIPIIIIFLIYFTLICIIIKKRKWTFFFVLGIFLLTLIPLGTFAINRKITSYAN